jgi:hypothetical protein
MAETNEDPVADDTGGDHMVETGEDFAAGTGNTPAAETGNTFVVETGEDSAAGTGEDPPVAEIREDQPATIIREGLWKAALLSLPKRAAPIP